jgi:hypothetical protein
LRVKMNDLPKRMNTRVGSPRADCDHRVPGDEGQRGLDRVLNRGAVRLRLPAGVVGAVILDDGGDATAELGHSLAGQILD